MDDISQVKENSLKGKKSSLKSFERDRDSPKNAKVIAGNARR